MAMHNLVLISETIQTEDLVGDWETFEMKRTHSDGRVVEVYATSEAGATLDVLAVGAFNPFDDDTPPQFCAYYATGISVPASLPGPGYKDIVPAGAVLHNEEQQTMYLGLKGTGKVTVTIKSEVRP